MKWEGQAELRICNLGFFLASVSKFIITLMGSFLGFCVANLSKLVSLKLDILTLKPHICWNDDHDIENVTFVEHVTLSKLDKLLFLLPIDFVMKFILSNMSDDFNF